MTLQDLAKTAKQKLLAQKGIIVRYVSFCLSQDYRKNGGFAKYLWKRGTCAYDSSGCLEPDGWVDIRTTTLGELNDHCYNGSSVATFESHCGLRWTTYEESINYYFAIMGFYLLSNILREFFPTKESAQRFCLENKIPLSDANPWDALMEEIQCVGVDEWAAAALEEPEFASLRDMALMEFFRLSREERIYFQTPEVPPEQFFHIVSSLQTAK